MKVNGFTLIELLAVIVVLGIISLISIPMILNTIEEVQKGAIKETVNQYISDIELSAVKKIIESNIKFNGIECNLLNDNMECTNDQTLQLNIKGDKLDVLSVDFDETGVIHTGTFKKNKYCGNYIKNRGVKFTECGEEEIIDANMVTFTPSDATWEVSSVQDALNDLYNR